MADFFNAPTSLAALLARLLSGILEMVHAFGARNPAEMFCLGITLGCLIASLICVLYKRTKLAGLLFVAGWIGPLLLLGVYYCTLIFPSRPPPGSDLEQLRWYGEMERKSVDGLLEDIVLMLRIFSIGLLFSLPIYFIEKVVRSNHSPKTLQWTVCLLTLIAICLLHLFCYEIRVGMGWIGRDGSDPVEVEAWP
jgi:hypothetical protein